MTNGQNKEGEQLPSTEVVGNIPYIIEVMPISVLIDSAAATI
jgi:hypothetical protein